MLKQLTVLVIVLLCARLAVMETAPDQPVDLWVTVEPLGQHLSIYSTQGAENPALMLGRTQAKKGGHPVLGTWGQSIATKDHPSSHIQGESWKFRADGTFTHESFERNLISRGMSNPQYSTKSETKHGHWRVSGKMVELYFDPQ